MRTALSEVDTAFRLLVQPPGPLTFDARPIAGLPNRSLPLDTLRDLMCAPTMRTDVSDTVWRILMANARTGDAKWVVGAAGMAAPGLTRLTTRLTHGRPAMTDDIASEVLTGFLQALRHTDAGPPRVWLRLCWAAWRAGYKVRQTEQHLELPTDVPVGSRSPHRPYGHPDLVLGRAVAARIITRAQADLIGATRLGDVLIEQLATHTGESSAVIRMRRRRAERRLIGAIQRGDLIVPYASRG